PGQSRVELHVNRMAPVASTFRWKMSGSAGSSAWRRKPQMTTLERQLVQRLSLALRHPEPEDACDSRRDIGRANRPFRPRSFRHAGPDRDEPHATARFVAAAVVRESISRDVAIASELRANK